MSISSDIRQKEKAINDLKKNKTDLNDDTGDISTINKLVLELQEDFKNFLSSVYTPDIVSKISNYVEPFQDNDTNLQSAIRNIDYEISALNKEIIALGKAKEAMDKARIAIQGIR